MKTSQSLHGSLTEQRTINTSSKYSTVLYNNVVGQEVTMQYIFSFNLFYLPDSMDSPYNPENNIC